MTTGHWPGVMRYNERYVDTGEPEMKQSMLHTTRACRERRTFSRPVIFTVAAALWVGVASQAHAGQDWPQWRGPHGDGMSRETDWQASFPDSGPSVLWSVDVGLGYASVAVADGRVYTAGWRDGKDTVYCLDAKSGKIIWDRGYPASRYDSHTQGGPSGTPAVDGDRVYNLSPDGRLLCLNTKDGSVHWAKTVTDQFGAKIPRWGIAGSPIVLGKVVFVDVGLIIAFNKNTGEVIWKTKDYGSAYSTPRPFKRGGRQWLAVFPKFGLVLLDASTGKEITKYPWPTHADVNAATPVIQGDHFFISSGYNTGGALLRLQGRKLQLVWEDKVMRNHMATCVLIDGHLYGIDDNRLRCLDAATGEVKWSDTSVGKGTLTAANGKLIVLSDRGDLMFADASPQAFDPVARTKVLDDEKCWTVPVLAHAKIYCRSGSGELVSIDVSGE